MVVVVWVGTTGKAVVVVDTVLPPAPGVVVLVVGKTPPGTTPTPGTMIPPDGGRIVVVVVGRIAPPGPWLFPESTSSGGITAPLGREAVVVVVVVG